MHDWLALTLLFVIVGHIGKALAEPIALRAMRRGTVPASSRRGAPPALVARRSAAADQTGQGPVGTAVTPP